jgi:uncharacterized membrane protein YfcA
MAPWFVLVLAGAVIGALTGIFGVGGSSIATPVLSLLGVPGLAAIASPLPATIPSAMAAALPYLKSGQARPKAAGWTLVGGVPGTIAGALLSRVVGAPFLLVVSGFVLVPLGLRVIRPVTASSRVAGTRRRKDRPLLVMASALVGLLTGLLANGGGFLLVPMYLLIFGLDMKEAAGTSLVVALLSVPTLATHWALGHVDWEAAGSFALGSIPASAISGRIAHRFAGDTVRMAFGIFLIVSGPAFVLYRVAQT